EGRVALASGYDGAADDEGRRLGPARESVPPDDLAVGRVQGDHLARREVRDVELAVVVCGRRRVLGGDVGLPDTLAVVAVDREGQAVVVDPVGAVTDDDRRVLHQLAWVGLPAALERTRDLVGRQVP